jgi:hypothetical protein
MFEQTFVDGVGKTNRVWTVMLSFIGQVLLIGVFILLPMIYFDALPRTQLTSFLVAPPPPPPPPPVYRIYPRRDLFNDRRDRFFDDGFGRPRFDHSRRYRDGRPRPPVAHPPRWDGKPPRPDGKPPTARPGQPDGKPPIVLPGQPDGKPPEANGKPPNLRPGQPDGLPPNCHWEGNRRVCT